MLQLALLGRDESSFQNIFLCSGKECLDFCLKLANAVRARQFSLFSTKTPGDGDLQHFDKCKLDFIGLYVRFRTE